MRDPPFTLKLFVKDNSLRMYPQYNQIDSDNPIRSGDSMNQPQREGEYGRKVSYYRENFQLIKLQKNCRIALSLGLNLGDSVYVISKWINTSF